MSSSRQLSKATPLSGSSYGWTKSTTPTSTAGGPLPHRTSFPSVSPESKDHLRSAGIRPFGMGRKTRLDLPFVPLHAPLIVLSPCQPIDRSKVVKHDAKLAEGEIDLTETLGEFGLEGVIVTADELAELVAGLGLGDKQASALVKGIADASAAANPPQSPAPEKEKEETKKEPEKVPEKKEPVRTPSKIPTPTIKTPPATRPIVKVDTETTPAPSEATLVASPMQVPPSPNLLSPLASREVMSELAKRVRSRTDALPRRMSSMSPSPISTPILESTIPEDSVPPIPEEKTLPKRTRKASTIESAKPKVAFPSTPGGEDPPELPKVSPSASVPPSPAQRERRISNMGGRSPAVASPPSAFPASPARSRKTSSTGGPPSAFPASSSSDAISSQGTTPARQRKTSAAFGAAKPKLPSSGSNTPSKS